MRSHQRVGFSLTTICVWLFTTVSLCAQVQLPPEDDDFFESPILQTQSFESQQAADETLEDLPAPLVRSLRTGGGSGMGGISGSPMGGMGETFRYSNP